jgi:hypothetical protein
MRMPRKRAGARKVRISIRDEVMHLRRQVEQLQTSLNELRKSAEDLRRGHLMSLRRFGELQFDLDALKKFPER